MNQEFLPSPPRAAGYEFPDDADGRYRGRLPVFPLEPLWESPQPMGVTLGKRCRTTPLQWEGLLSEDARREVDADSYAAFWESLSRTRAQTSVLMPCPSRRLLFSSKPRRYACGNLLMRDGWCPGSPFELYAFSSEVIAAAGKGYRHRLTPSDMQLVRSGTLPTDGI